MTKTEMVYCNKCSRIVLITKSFLLKSAPNKITTRGLCDDCFEEIFDQFNQSVSKRDIGDKNDTIY